MFSNECVIVGVVADAPRSASSSISSPHEYDNLGASIASIAEISDKISGSPTQKKVPKITVEFQRTHSLERSSTSPRDIIWHAGSFVVTDRRSRCVTRIDPGGSIEILCWGKDGLPNTASEMQPHGIVALSGSEPIFLFTDYKNGCILKYDKRRDNCHIWNKGKSELTKPTGICRDTFGKVYVADEEDRSIHVFDVDGKHERRIGDQCLRKPGLIAINSHDQLHVADEAAGIYVFRLSNGEYLFKLDLAGMRHCHGIVFDKYDNIFISTRLSSWWKRLSYTKLESDGIFDKKHYKFAAQVGGPRGFDKVRSLCIDHTSDILAVVDGENKRIAAYQLRYEMSV